MSKMLPAAIEQMIADLKDKNTPAHVKFNRAQVLEVVKDECEAALNAYKKKR